VSVRESEGWKEFWIVSDLRRNGMEEQKLSVKIKGRVNEKKGRSEHKFKLIIRLRNTCQVSQLIYYLKSLVL